MNLGRFVHGLRVGPPQGMTRNARAAAEERSQVSALTRREMDVMAVLWDLGSATVAEVNERLDDDLAYTRS